MALLNLTSGASSDLAVVRVSPKVLECFTLYEFIVTANTSDSITITLTGNHYEESFTNSSGNTTFIDTTTTVFDGYLSITFLLLNSGTTGVYHTTTLNVTNNTTGFYYENVSTRQNDGANCYESGNIPTKTSELLNDGHDGVNPFVDTVDLSAYLPLAGGTMSGAINMGTNNILDIATLSADFVQVGVMEINDAGAFTYIQNETSYTASSDGRLSILDSTGQGIWYGPFTFNDLAGVGTRTVTVDASGNIGTTALNTDADNIVFDSYLTITSVNVQAAIEELKDEVDLLGAVTIDSVLTNGSTNPVENNAIYDEFQLVSYLASSNNFTGGTNTFANTVVIHDSTDGLEIYNDGTDNRIDTNADNLKIYSQSNPAGGWTFQIDSGLVGTSSAYLYAPYITVDDVAYGAGWDGSNRVPTRNAVYDKIESLSLGGAQISGTPVDSQIAVWTNATTIEGASTLTYDGSNLQLTGDIGSTGTRITKGWFTDLEVTNAIAGSITGNAATVTSIGNLTGDVTSVNRATTIATGAVDIPMLSATGTPSSSNFLRGDNTWSVPAGAGDVTKVGTPVNNQIGVWTGDGTIEGDANFTWDGVNAKISANNVWHEGNDGTGSGLDADTLDGNQATAFYRSNLANTAGTGSIQLNDGYSFTVGTSSDMVITHSGGNNLMDLSSGNLVIRDGTTTRFTFARTTGHLTATNVLVDDEAYAVAWNGSLEVPTKNAVYDEMELKLDATQYTAADVLAKLITVDGSGSGLDADLLDGISSGSFLRSDVEDSKTLGDLILNDDVALAIGTTAANRFRIYTDVPSAVDLRIDTPTDGVLFIREGNTGAAQWQMSMSNYTISTTMAIGSTADITAPNYNITNSVPYGVAWDGDDTAPTRNEVYDKIESLSVGGGDYLNASVSDTFSGGVLYFNDNSRIGLGSGYDSSIYHNGSTNLWDVFNGNILFRSSTNTRFTFTMSSGNLTATGNMYAVNFFTTSDERYKENIETLVPEDFDVRWVTYLDESKNERTGVIAQELETVRPQYVEEDSFGVKRVALMDLLIERIALLEKKVEELQNG